VNRYPGFMEDLRETSQAKWKTYKTLSIGVNITVKY